MAGLYRARESDHSTLVCNCTFVFRGEFNRVPRYFVTATFLILAVTLLLWKLPEKAPATATAPAAQNAAATADDAKPYTETMPGTSVKFEMIPIAGGTFTMGSPATEAGRNPDEGPPHEVTVRPFWMGKTEVSWDEYDQFASARS